MRSWRELAVVATIVTGAACGTDSVETPDPPDLPPGACDDSFLDYQNFGAPFVANWCRGCHSSEVPVAMRQHAPADINFDDHATTMQYKDRILVRATGEAPTMPPAGGPSAEERALLVEWLACGGK